MLNPDLANFTYSSQPHAAPTRTVTKQPRYRDPNEAPLTLMSDPRVIRGSTHVLAKKIALSKAEMSRTQPISRLHEEVQHEPRTQPTYRFEVKPFSNNEIDVSRYLVQQTDYRPQNKTLDTQTDTFLPRPDTPEYVPAKVGVDTGTQVDDLTELFDFDTEAAPIVEVITQKTIDQALFELGSEEELKNLESAARDFRAEKFRSEEWMRNRENQAIKENKQRRERIQALQTARENEKRTKTIIAGVQMMRQTFPDSLARVYDELVKSGVWQEIDDAIAEKEFLPQVIEQSAAILDAHVTARELVDAILAETEGRYQSFPHYVPPGAPRRFEVVVTFRRAPPEEGETEVEGEGSGESDAASGTRARRKPADVTVMTVQVGPRDTVDTLDRRIRNEVNRLRNLAARAAEAAAAAAEAAELAAAEAKAAAPEGAAEGDGEGEDGGAVGSAVPAPAVPEEGGPSINTVLPDNAALAPLRSLLYENLTRSLSPDLLVNTSAPVGTGGGGACGILQRDMAYDAALWNFPFPEVVSFEILV